MIFFAHLTSAVQWILLSSFKASVLIGFILILQWLLRRKLPVRWSYALWLLLFFRLMIPFEIGSRVSLFNLMPIKGDQVSLFSYDMSTESAKVEKDNAGSVFF